MAVEAKRSTITSGRGSSYVVDLVFGLAVPLLFCTLLVQGRVVHLLSLVQDGAFSDIRGVQEIVHLSLSIVFVALMGFLFLTRKKAVGPGASWTDRLVALAGGVVVPSVLMFASEPRQLSNGMLLSSLVALLLGNVLSIWSLSALGRCFGVFPAARGLVRHGPYQLVRHPLYVAEAIAVFGLLLARLSPLTIAIFVVAQALQVWRARNEERVLQQVFPEYASYQQTTGRFLPRLHSSR